MQADMCEQISLPTHIQSYQHLHMNTKTHTHTHKTYTYTYRQMRIGNKKV